MEGLTDCLTLCSVAENESTDLSSQTHKLAGHACARAPE